MFNVTNADEALAVARELCRRHPGLVHHSQHESAKEAALRVILAEAAQPGSLTPRRARGDGASPSPRRNMSPVATNTAPILMESGTFRPPHHSRHDSVVSSGKASTRRSGGPGGKSAECFYCNEPSSRFCKETGRRHESGTEKAKRQWRRIYRQLALASSFVSSARLAKGNTCVEEYAIDLNLDDI